MLFLLMQLNPCHFRFPMPLILIVHFWVFSPHLGIGRLQRAVYYTVPVVLNHSCDNIIPVI